MAATTRELERSNSTTATFLGAKQRTWMIPGNKDPSTLTVSLSKPNDSSYSAEAPFREDMDFLNELRDAAQQANSSNNSPGQAVTTVLPTTLSDGDGEGAPVVTPSSGSVSYRIRSNRTAHSRDPQLARENHLPSPSPSEDHVHESDGINVNHPISSRLPSDPTTATRLEQLMAKYGSVDEIEKHLVMAEKSTTTRGNPTGHEPLTRTNSTPQAAVHFSAGSTSIQSAPSGAPSNPININAASPNKDQQVTKNPQRRLERQIQSVPHHLFWPFLNAAFVNYQRGERSEFNELTRKCTEAISDRIKAVSTIANRGGIEYPRLLLLQDACCHSDFSFLMLHQLYCWADDKSAKQSYRDIGQLQAQGFHVLKRPLASNDGLPQDAIAWFACFPGRLDTNLVSLWYEDTLQTLCQLALHWDGLQSACLTRKFPPLSSEMLNLLQVSSVKLQEVIFRVMLRDIMKETDSCFQKHEQIFFRNQQFVNEQITRGGDVSSRNDEFEDEHRKIWSSHQSHVRGSSALSPSTAVPFSWTGQSALGRSDSRANSIANTSRQGTESSHFVDAQHPRASNIRSASASAQFPAVLRSTPISGHSNPHDESSRLNHASLSELEQHPLSETNAQGAHYSLDSQRVLMPSSQTATYSGQSHHAQSTVNDPSNITSNIGPWASAESHRLQQNLTQPVLISSANINHPSTRTTQASPEVLTTPHHHTHPHQNFNSQPHPIISTGTRQQNPAQNLPSERFIRIPAPRSQYALPEQPAPLMTALHHARVSSPTISTDTEENCFGCVQNVFIAPKAMSHRVRYQQYSVSLTTEDVNALAKDTYSIVGAAHSRLMRPNSYTYRIKCVKSKLGTEAPNKDDWRIASHCWPPYTAILLNDQALEIRRKSHYVKDLPIDATRIVKEGQNLLTIAVMDPSSDSVSDEQFFFGLEAIETLTQSQVKTLLSSLDEQTAQQRIISRTKITSDDPDLEILRQDMDLDLTDPFSAQIFDMPVRGNNCTHTQCFDLDNFLNTRSGGMPKDKPNRPCSPDEFRCPICKGDASPDNLVIDSFFRNVRAKLQAIGRLDVKAVTLNVDGGWTIKEEEERRGQSGDGDGRRAKSQEDRRMSTAQKDRQSSLHVDRFPPSRIGSMTAAEISNSAELTVVELDDD